MDKNVLLLNLRTKADRSLLSQLMLLNLLSSYR